jgi:hypothetical protein
LLKPVFCVLLARLQAIFATHINAMATIGIIGGTGFVGSHLAALLAGESHKVIIFSRSKGKTSGNPLISYAHFDYTRKECDTDALAKLTAVVNLAGAGVADKRLTAKRKAEIISSRVDNTHYLIAQLRAHAPGCKTFVAASATGYYGWDKPDGQPFTEGAAPATDFLGTTCRDWEAASHMASPGMRTVILRIGIVLGKEGGAFPQFVAPMAFGVMPILGSGKQIVSWIGVNDLARLMAFALGNEAMNGTYNAVAPAPVTHKKLMQTIATLKGGIKIPIPVPGFLLRIALGGRLSNESRNEVRISPHL